MSGNVLFIGLDVDDKSFHGCALAADGKQSREFKLRPTTASLTKKLLDLKREFGVSEIRVCYEATYIGYTLQRALSESGFVCEVGALKTRRKNAPPEIISIADRCHKRLYKKSFRLLMGGKHPNKVKVACAREMVGFIWESLRAAS